MCASLLIIIGKDIKDGNGKKTMTVFMDRITYNFVNLSQFFFPMDKSNKMLIPKHNARWVTPFTIKYRKDGTGVMDMP